MGCVDFIVFEITYVMGRKGGKINCFLIDAKEFVSNIWFYCKFDATLLYYFFIIIDILIVLV